MKESFTLQLLKYPLFYLIYVNAPTRNGIHHKNVFIAVTVFRMFLKTTEGDTSAPRYISYLLLILLICGRHSSMSCISCGYINNFVIIR